MTDVAAAAAAIRAGRLAVVPTDTVYGLAASPYSEAPVRALYRAKGREELQPTALVAADLEQLLECVPELLGRAGGSPAHCCPARTRSCSRTPLGASRG